jgi:hypothetical protein
MVTLPMVFGLAIALPANTQEQGEATKLKQLQKERLATVRDMLREITIFYQQGKIDPTEVSRAIRMVFEAELELCESGKERIATWERLVEDTKKFEKVAEARVQAGAGRVSDRLAAKAHRLEAEIGLERARAQEKGQSGKTKRAEATPDNEALAEKQVAIKRAAVKVAEAQVKVAVAKLKAANAQLADAQSNERLAEQRFKRFQDLAKSGAVAAELLEEQATKCDAAKNRKTALEGSVAEAEANVLVEQALVDVARLEVEEAELRLKHLQR